jgi:Domain of unknown function (DUF4276)
MSRPTIASVVEGDGEVRALPVLVRRIAYEFQDWDIDVPTPFRIPRSRLVKPDHLVTAVSVAAERVSGAGGVLVLLDADDDCPAKLGPSLLSTAQGARSDKVVTLVLPNREFEAWFLAAAESLAGKRGLSEGLRPPADPDTIRGAKEWLSAHCDHPYKETVDQAALAHEMDLQTARDRSRSFRKLWHEIARLLGANGDL